jgi:hypothetical protein
MFCGVYDLFGTMHPLVAHVVKRQYTPEGIENWTNYCLQVVHYRYTLYLDLLVSLRHTPKDRWPLPQWYIRIRVNRGVIVDILFQGHRTYDAHPHALPGQLRR